MNILLIFVESSFVHEAFLMVIYDHHKIVEKETDVSGCV